MVWEIILGFIFLVIGTYIGATWALRDFFGQEYYDPRTGESAVRENNSDDGSPD